MHIIEILRLLTGYVIFRADGGFGERFINLCSQNGIALWDIESYGEEIIASTTIEGYRNILPSAKKSGMKTHIIKECGLPFLIFRHRKRIGIPIGFLIFTITLTFLSTRVWLIDVEGCSTVPEETVLAAVENAGLRAGCSRRKTDSSLISLNVEKNVEGVSEIKINIIGSKATVIVKERAPAPGIGDASGTYDIIAAKDAQLLILEPYRGTAAAKLFNTVLKGETLISGVVANKDESAHYVHASGYAVGRTETVIKEKSSGSEKYFTLKTVKKRKKFFFLGIAFPQYGRNIKSDFVFSEEKAVSFSGQKMPAGIIETDYLSYSESTVRPDSRQLELISIERYMQKAALFVATRQVTAENVTESFGEKDKTVQGKFICYENIGIEREFKVNELDDSEINYGMSEQ